MGGVGFYSRSVRPLIYLAGLSGSICSQQIGCWMSVGWDGTVLFGRCRTACNMEVLLSGSSRKSTVELVTPPQRANDKKRDRDGKSER